MNADADRPVLAIRPDRRGFQGLAGQVDIVDVLVRHHRDEDTSMGLTAEQPLLDQPL